MDLMPRKVSTNRFGEGLVVVVRYTVVVCLNPLSSIELELLKEIRYGWKRCNVRGWYRVTK